MRLVPAGLTGWAPRLGETVPARPHLVLEPHHGHHGPRPGEGTVGERPSVVRSALDRHQVRADVTSRDQPPSVVPTPDLARQQTPFEVRAAGAVLGEGVDDGPAAGELEEVRKVGRTEHVHSLTRTEPGQGHTASLRVFSASRTARLFHQPGPYTSSPKVRVTVFA